MRVNPKIHEMMVEISEKTIKYINNPDEERKYLRRLLNAFNDHLSEDEKIFVFKNILEHIHFRSLNTDEKMLLTLSGIKMKRTLLQFVLFNTTMVVAYFLFVDNQLVNEFIRHIQNAISLIRL